MTSTLHVPRRAQVARAPVRLLGLGTATPAHISQSDAARLAEPLCCDTDEQRQFLQRIFRHSGVSSRAGVLADEGSVSRLMSFYRPRTGPDDRGPTTQERMRLYEQFAPELARRSATAAIENADLDPLSITHLIPVTCTGFFSPGLDAHLINSLGLSHEVQRVQVGFMGCHGAFNGLVAANAIAQADSSARVLVTCVELCSLHMAYGFHPQRLVANALFADGSSSVIIGVDANSAADGKPQFVASSTMLLPNSQDAMTWRIGDAGFEMTLSPAVPDLVQRHVPAWIDAFTSRNHMSLTDIAHYAVHPGGPKILTAVADALTFSHNLLGPSRQVLSDHGNMSSATILFVLEHLLKTHSHGSCLALGFGPGLTAEAILLHL